ncbi:MAG: SpoIVB peptidase [Candidatus Ruminococcus intestinipullorum]|nr:SpoIVB peptidase [Candidatus Ruminococcus intestinipullorum]
MKKTNKKFSYFFFLVSFVVFVACMGGVSQSIEEGTEVSSVIDGESAVLVGGMPIGIYIEMDGVMVLKTDTIKGVDGQEYSPAKNAVLPGDYMVALNEQHIESKKHLLQLLSQLNEDEIVLTIRRNQEEFKVKIKPVEYNPGEYKLGIWVRDNVQGLGTVTFMTSKGKFGALGHGIHDIDTNTLLELKDGTAYKTSIHSIQKGTNGNPGSLGGIIVYNYYNRLGEITKNTEEGIYGTIGKVNELFEEQTVLPVASKEQIHTGDAKIRCFVEGEVQEYDIKILEIDTSSHAENKGIVLQVTDLALLEQTGGIIQGMSGSPIIQDGKLIGAVTHVFVQDSTKGYGIFIENMLKHVE